MRSWLLTRKRADSNPLKKLPFFLGLEAVKGIALMVGKVGWLKTLGRYDVVVDD